MRRAWLSLPVWPVWMLAGVCGSCAGAGVKIVADQALYPISMSASVRDNTGMLHDVRSLKAVGSFDFEESRLGFVYSTFTPRAKLDISEAVNTQVEAAGGEAVIRLSVTVDDSCHWLNEMFLLNALPIWPGCVPVKIHGTIVRRKTGVLAAPSPVSRAGPP